MSNVQLFANNASTTLTSSIVSGDLALTVADGSAFPSPGVGQFFLVTVELASLREIIKIIARSGNVLTVDPAGRGQEGTSAAGWASGSVVECRTTANTLGAMARYTDLIDSYSGTVYAPGTFAFTNKSILFSGTDGRIKQDNTNFTYDSGATLLSVPNATVSTLIKTPAIDSGYTGALAFKTNSGTQQFAISHVASSVNWLGVKGATTGNGGVLESLGAGTDIDILISPKGNGIARFTGAYGYSGVISPAQITATQNDYNPTGAGSASVLRVNSDTLRTITGFSGGASGRVVTFINIGSFSINFTNEDAGSTAANRFKLNIPTITIPTNGAISFWYDTAQSRWVGFSAPSSSVDTVQTLVDQATIAWDTSLGGWGIVTLGANRIFGAPTNAVDGKEYVLFMIQDATGTRTITSWNAVFKWPLGAVPVLSTAPGSIDMFSFKVRGGNFYGGFLKGMA